MDRVWSVLVLALAAGCAPPVVGGTWHTGPLTLGARVADDVVVEFVDGSTARATIVQGGLNTCTERHTRSVQGTWRPTAAGLFVAFRCVEEVPCGAGTYTLCDILDNAIVGDFEQSGVNTLSSVDHRPIRLTRR